MPQIDVRSIQMAHLTAVYGPPLGGSQTRRAEASPAMASLFCSLSLPRSVSLDNLYIFGGNFWVLGYSWMVYGYLEMVNGYWEMVI